VTAGAIGYLRGRSISKALDITSAPALEDAHDFWESVLEFCRTNHVAEIAIDSFGARHVALPVWPAPALVRDRVEWVLNLGDCNSANFATNHRRNIKKAGKLGVMMLSTSSPAAADVHACMMAASMRRRYRRGERVSSIQPQQAPLERALLTSGAGRLYQAVYHGKVVSSLMLLKASDGAYYQSAGTTEEGMAISASTFLVSEIIRSLMDEGRSVFNLGGAGPESEGLQRFKAGFGAQPVNLSAGVYQIASPIHRKLRAVVHLLREPESLRRSLARRIAAL
jgi:lipid II:glycine glycyltransferase (peptidoglycan interpeptide bridge formation enzyme)